MARGKRAERDKQDVRDRRDVKFEVIGWKFRTLRSSAFRPPHLSSFFRPSRPSHFSDAANDLVREIFLKVIRELKGGQLELPPHMPRGQTPDPL
jgi:hypothetical protein